MNEETKEMILEKIKPNKLESELINNTQSLIIDKLHEVLKRWNVNYEKIVPVGSVAKGTNLTKNADIDIFVLLPLSQEIDQIEDYVLPPISWAINQLYGEVERKYASHPYLSTEINGYNVDIVPAYKIEDISEMKSAVDRTPLHTKWVNEHLSDEEKDEVLLLKQFFKNNYLYGANESTKGFSGYLCEILIYIYGSCQEAILSKFTFYYDGEKVHIQDPIDSSRNVAANLSLEQYYNFVNIANKYIMDGGDYKYYCPIPVKPDLVYVPGLYMNLGIIEDENEEIAFAKFDKKHRSMVKEMEDIGFSVLRNQAFKSGEKMYGMFLFASLTLPERSLIEGPPLFKRDACLEYMKKHPKTFQRDGYLCRIVGNTETDVVELFGLSKPGRDHWEDINFYRRMKGW